MKVFLVTHSYYEMDRREKLRILSTSFGVNLTLLLPACWKHSLRDLIFTPGVDEPYRTLSKKAILAGRNNLYFYPCLPCYIISRWPQIVHCEEEPFSFTTCASIILGKSIGARTLFFTWQNLPMFLPFPYNFFDRISMRLADAAIAGNFDGKQILKKKGFTKPIFVIPQLGISHDFGKKVSQEPMLPRLSGNGFIAGFVGRIIKFKGIDTLIRAISLLGEENTALIIGRGEELPALRKLAAELEIEGRITFMDTVPHEDIARYMKTMDVLVLPSLTGEDWKEQFGQVLIEAMSCGTPVVGSDSGAIPSVIGNAGMVFKEGDANDLAEKLKHMMNETVRESFRQKGFNRVESCFTHERVAAATHAVYRYLLDAPPPESYFY